MIGELINVISPVWIIACIGFIWVKKGYDFPTDFVTRMNMNIGAPCLIFTGIMTFGDQFDQATTFMFAAFVSICCLLVCSAVFTLVFRLPFRAYVVAIASTNSGNIGLPLCLFAFGEAGLALGVAFFTVAVVFQFTISLAISHGSLTPAALTRITLLWGIAAAIFFIQTGVEPPKWLMNTTKLMAGVTIPLMLLTLGASLARIKFQGSGKLVAIGGFKMILGLSIGIGVASLFGFQGMERNILVLQMSTPVAVFSYLLATQFNRNPQDVAALIFITTLLSAVSVPLLLSYLL